MQRPASQFDREELDWLAFRYIAGELSEPEAAEFEERLAVDQAAREAVARSVELTSTLAATREESTTVEAGSATSRTWKAVAGRGSLSRSRWGLLASTAALALLTTIVWWPSSSRDEVSVTDAETHDAEQLVAMWSDKDFPAVEVKASPVDAKIEPAHQPAAQNDEPAELVAQNGNDDIVDLTPDRETDADKNAEQDRTAAPDWMVAGVSLELSNELQIPAKGER